MADCLGSRHVKSKGKPGGEHCMPDWCDPVWESWDHREGSGRGVWQHGDLEPGIERARPSGPLSAQLWHSVYWWDHLAGKGPGAHSHPWGCPSLTNKSRGARAVPAGPQLSPATGTGRWTLPRANADHGCRGGVKGHWDSLQVAQHPTR